MGNISFLTYENTDKFCQFSNKPDKYFLIMFLNRFNWGVIKEIFVLVQRPEQY